MTVYAKERVYAPQPRPKEEHHASAAAKQTKVIPFKMSCRASSLLSSPITIRRIPGRKISSSSWLPYQMILILFFASMVSSISLQSAESSLDFPATFSVNPFRHASNPDSLHRYIASRQAPLLDGAADSLDNTIPDSTVEDTIGDESAASAVGNYYKGPLPSDQADDLHQQRCIPLEECQYCPSKYEDTSTVPPECVETGRRQRYECTTTAVDDTTKHSEEENPKVKHYTMYKSCASTPTDDYFAVLRMQVICLIIGIYSLRQVNRQKRLSASLFDQRRYNSSSSASSSASASRTSSDGTSTAATVRKAGDGGAVYTSVSTTENGESKSSSGSKGKVSSSSQPTTRISFVDQV